MNDCNALTQLSGSWCLIVTTYQNGWGRSARISKTAETPIWQYVVDTLAQFGEEISDSPAAAITVETVDERTGGFIKVSIDFRRLIPKQVP